MSAFGKGLIKRKAAGAAAAAEPPAPKMGKRPPVLLEHLDLSKIEFSNKVENGNQGDKFVRANLDGGRIEIALAALPNFSRAPFDAGPPKTTDGQPLGNQWSFSVELTMEQYEKFTAYEKHVVDSLMPLRNELFPKDAKKKKGGMTEDDFAAKYNTKLTPPNPEKGYAPTLRVFIETDPERQPPNIQLMHLLDGNQCTRPIKGSVTDLKAKSAVVLVMSLVRGVYAGQTGLGCKFSATLVHVLTNLQQSNAPEPDYSGITFVDRPTPREGDAPLGAPPADDLDNGDESAEGEGEGVEEEPFTSDQFDDAMAAQQVVG